MCWLKAIKSMIYDKHYDQWVILCIKPAQQKIKTTIESKYDLTNGSINLNPLHILFDDITLQRVP